MIKLDKSWEKASDNYCRKENGEYYTDIDIKPMKGAFYYGASRFQDKAIEKLTNYITSELSLSKEDNLVDKGLFKAIEIIKNLKAVD